MTDLDKLIQRLGIRMSLMDADLHPNRFPQGTCSWLACFRLTPDGLPVRTMRVPFYSKPDVPKPSPADVLSSLMSEALEGEKTFHDFCDEHGGIAAMTTWAQCREVSTLLRAFLGEHYITVANTEHE